MPIAKGLAEVAGLAEHLERPITVVDLGCRWGFADAWAALGRHATIVGFDPDAAECERLNREYAGAQDVRFIGAAVGARNGPAPFYLTREPACGSFFPPDPVTIRHRPILECAEAVGRTSVTLTTLDDWAASAGPGPIDALKLDTQGSELGILQGAGRCLESVRLLEVEVMFNEIYRGQPLFGDIDRFLRGRGFVLWRLGHLVHYGMAGARSDFARGDVQCFDSRRVPFASEGGQLYWANAHFVRRDIAFGEESADWRGCLRDALLASVFGFRDLAGDTLLRARRHAPRDVADAIGQALTT